MKKLLASLAVMAIFATTAHATTFKLPFTISFCDKSKNTELVLLPTMQSKTDQQNRAWVGTFQIVWNDMQDKIVKRPIVFVDDPDNQMAKDLNKQKFKASMLSQNAYYKTYGAINPSLKNEIETAIMKKFNEKSDILGMIDWTPIPGKFLVYAMLKKDFKFATPFDKLEPSRFGKFQGKVDFFGIDKNSDSDLDKMVTVLFYNNKDDFAVAIRTLSKDMIYLYRTNDNKSFDKYYKDMKKKESMYMNWHDFLEEDELRIPDIDMYKLQQFPELTKKRIKGTDLQITDAIQTAEFKMNNVGVELKSEASISMETCSLEPEKKSKPRKFFFDDTFILFLQETDKKQPYFALRVYDLGLINKTSKSASDKETK